MQRTGGKLNRIFQTHFKKNVKKAGILREYACLFEKVNISVTTESKNYHNLLFATAPLSQLLFHSAWKSRLLTHHYMKQGIGNEWSEHKPSGCRSLKISMLSINACILFLQLPNVPWHLDANYQLNRCYGSIDRHTLCHLGLDR